MVCIFRKKFFPWKIIGDGHEAQWFRSTEVDSGKTPVEIKFGITRLFPPGFGFPTDLGSVNKLLFTLICVKNYVRFLHYEFSQQFSLDSRHLTQKWMRWPHSALTQFIIYRETLKQKLNGSFIHLLNIHFIFLCNSLYDLIPYSLPVCLLAVSSIQTVNSLRVRICLLCSLLKLQLLE